MDDNQMETTYCDDTQDELSESHQRIGEIVYRSGVNDYIPRRYPFSSRALVRWNNS